MTTIGLSPRPSALRVTNRVCGIGPSAASTRIRTPSTMRRIRSTSPPKSACPGVSTMLIFTSPQRIDVFLARIVMPRSRSSGLLSMTRSTSAAPARNTPAWRSIWSTSVVFPWSTWAIMATLRMDTATTLEGSCDVRERPGEREKSLGVAPSAIPTLLQLHGHVADAEIPDPARDFGQGALGAPGISHHRVGAHRDEAAAHRPHVHVVDPLDVGHRRHGGLQRQHVHVGGR